MREAAADGGGDFGYGVCVAPALNVTRRQRAARRGRECDSREDGGDDQRARSEHGLRGVLERRMPSSYAKSLCYSGLGGTARTGEIANVDGALADLEPT